MPLWHCLLTVNNNQRGVYLFLTHISIKYHKNTISHTTPNTPVYFTLTHSKEKTTKICYKNNEKERYTPIP